MKNLKKLLPLLMVLITINLSAQGMKGKEGEGMHKEKFEELKKELDLSDDQAKAVRTIFKERNMKMKESVPTKEQLQLMTKEERKNNNGMQRKIRSQIHKETMEQMGKVLNEEQMTKYKEILAKRKPAKLDRHPDENQMKNQHMGGQPIEPEQ